MSLTAADILIPHKAEVNQFIKLIRIAGLLGSEKMLGVALADFSAYVVELTKEAIAKEV